jgi:NADPH2 dehydrogenase
MILENIRKEIPTDFPLQMRVSASDYATGGIDVHEMVKIVNQVKHLIDLVHVSSGGLVEISVKTFPGYQVEFSRIIKEQCNIPTIAVGLIDHSDLAEEIVQNNRADLVALGRVLLRNPYWVLNVAHANKTDNFIPKSYERGF